MCSASPSLRSLLLPLSPFVVRPSCVVSCSSLWVPLVLSPGCARPWCGPASCLLFGSLAGVRFLVLGFFAYAFFHRQPQALSYMLGGFFRFVGTVFLLPCTWYSFCVPHFLEESDCCWFLVVGPPHLYFPPCLFIRVYCSRALCIVVLYSCQYKGLCPA